MIETCSLASGSNGNSYFIKTGDQSFLVDAGISTKQICQRLEQIGHSITDINSIFISHEHTDHIRGLNILAKKYNTKIYMTQKTFENSNININPNLIHFIKADDTITIENTTIRSFSKCHDALDPCSYSFIYDNKKVSIITDIGIACSNVINNIKDSDAIFLESNYDENMLLTSPYPAYLKQRIHGDNGHLSNYHAGLLIMEHASPRLKYIFLSHLSENNNRPELALNTFKEVIKQRQDLKHLDTIITSRHEHSRLIRI